MPRTIRFHLDENCSHAIAAGLRRRGIDVTTTPEAGLLGAGDADPHMRSTLCLLPSRGPHGEMAVRVETGTTGSGAWRRSEGPQGI
jgi:hypothetical protein